MPDETSPIVEFGSSPKHLEFRKFSAAASYDRRIEAPPSSFSEGFGDFVFNFESSSDRYNNLNPSASEFIPDDLDFDQQFRDLDIESPTRNQLSTSCPAPGLVPHMFSFSPKNSSIFSDAEQTSSWPSEKDIDSGALTPENDSLIGSIQKKRNMTQGRKEQRRRAMVRRAMRHLLEWPLDKQEKCNRNYGLLIIEVPVIGARKIEKLVLPCKEVRKLCSCDDCKSSKLDDSYLNSEVRSREIVPENSGVLIRWNDGHASRYSYPELISLHRQILNVASQI
jgi:hypothetical protein